MNGAELIAQERQRQIDNEGYDAAHDDNHFFGEIAWAAACYAAPAEVLKAERIEPGNYYSFTDPWPWGPAADRRSETRNDEQVWLDPEKRIRELVKAGALIAAEIDRITRSLPGER